MKYFIYGDAMLLFLRGNVNYSKLRGQIIAAI